jgi:hypothetical protein
MPYKKMNRNSKINIIGLKKIFSPANSSGSLGGVFMR